MTPAPICKTCHKVMVKRRDEGYAKFMNRSWCSRDCRSRGEWKEKTPCPVKYCEKCKRPNPRGKNEGPINYGKRRFCSLSCARSTNRGHVIHQQWNAKYETPVIRETIPAATEEEFLRLNHGPTICPTRYVLPTNDASMRPFGARPSRTF